MVKTLEYSWYLNVTLNGNSTHYKSGHPVPVQTFTKQDCISGIIKFLNLLTIYNF